MPADLLDPTAAEVLTHYPTLLWSGGRTALGNRGGFSGVRLWRLHGAAGPLCLRAWPPSMPAERLAFIHRLMGRAADEGLSFVPRLFAARDQATQVEHGGRLWEVQEWLPGAADFHARPAPARLEAACEALARLHLVWQTALPPAAAICPAVRRRFDAVAEWRDRDRPAGRLPPQWPDAVPRMLARWRDLAVPLQPCHCDPWHDNVLFDGDRLTGLIDYGAVKVDHPAVDVARLLGSLAEDDGAAWAVGLGAYRRARPFSAKDEELARALDVTGTVVAVLHWLRRLYGGEHAVEDRTAAKRRLGELVDRIERWEMTRIGERGA